MTYLTKDIRDHLMGSVNIADAFGEHIYAEAIPQDAEWEEMLVINDLSNNPEYSLAGEVGTHTTIIQIDVWTKGAGGKPRVVALGEMVRNRLSGYRGQFGSGEYGTARLLRNDALAPPDPSGGPVHRRRVSQDYEIIHTADVPTFA